MCFSSRLSQGCHRIGPPIRRPRAELSLRSSAAGPDMSRIHALDALVVNKIAAGEVIERPASVVKELLENSVDALATRVDVEIGDGGSELIRVADDGEGIHPEDIGLAVTSHATSKITGADDLFRVRTMGFRGEALASIAAVSRLRLRSRRVDAELGNEISVEGGNLGPVQPCGCPVGTVIEVRNLLYNTPVRRKFLRAVATEFGHISEEFTRVALAHPKLTASLRHNQRSVYELPPTGQVLDRLKLFFGSDLADKLIWVESQTAEARIWGYVAHPSESRATRKGQYLFLNGRWIQDRSLQHALGEAYRGLLMTGRYPVVFLFLELAPELVDVNVHPTKAEVRFRDNQPLYRLLLSAIRTRFLSANLESTISVPKASGWRFENFSLRARRTRGTGPARCATRTGGMGAKSTEPMDSARPIHRGIAVGGVADSRILVRQWVATAFCRAGRSSSR